MSQNKKTNYLNKPLINGPSVISSEEGENRSSVHPKVNSN